MIQGVGYPEPESVALPLDGDLADGRGRPGALGGMAGPGRRRDPALGLCHVGPQSVPLAVRGRKAVPSRWPAWRTIGSRPAPAWRSWPNAPPTGDPVLNQVRRQFATARALAARLAAMPPTGARTSPPPLT